MKFSVDFSEIYQLFGENMKTPKLLYNKVVWNHPARYSCTVITSICTAVARLYIKTPLGGTTRYSQATRPYVAQLPWFILHQLAGSRSALD